MPRGSSDQVPRYLVHVYFNLRALKAEFRLDSGYVIHAGASTCQERRQYLENSFEPVLWIEALSDVASQASKILEDFPRQDIVVATLWNESNQEIAFHRASNDGESSSVFKMKVHRALHPGITQTAPEIHRTITLDEVMQSAGQEGPVSLLVLDLQGAELAALKGSHKTLLRTQAIFTEVSNVEMYANQPLFWDLHEFLESQGFVLVLHDLISTGGMGDALYVTRSHADRHQIETISLDKLPPKLKLTKLSKFRYLLIRVGVPSNWLSKRKR